MGAAYRFMKKVLPIVTQEKAIAVPQGEQILPPRITFIDVHFSSDRQSEFDMMDDYDAFCFYRALFERASNFTTLAENNINGGTECNGITELIFGTKNGKKIYVCVDGGYPVPEVADTEMYTEDCSEELIQEIVIAVEQFFEITIAEQKCIPMWGNAHILHLYEAPSQ